MCLYANGEWLNSIFVSMAKFLLVGLWILAFVACKPAYQPPEGWLKHENYNLKYTVHYPPTWKLSNQGSPDLLFYASSPKTYDEDPISENVNLISQIVAPDTDLERYITEMEAKATGQLQNIQKISSEKITFKDYPAIHGIYQASVNDVRVKWEQYVWIKDGRCYAFTYAAEIAQFDAYREVSHQIIESLQFY